MENTDGAQPLIYTIGHSTLSSAEFIEVLKSHHVSVLADVRSVPGSRHNPQFNREALIDSLSEQSIEYVHLAGLGGFRRPVEGSVNDGWENSSFRSYADYMQTGVFAESLSKLITTASKETVALMCSEAVPWRCHRSLIADALLTKGFEVVHIMAGGKDYAHKMTRFAVMADGKITYPRDRPRVDRP